MDISGEKQFIYEIMRDITAERRRLTDTYYKLQARLHTLYTYEERGLTDLNLSGYVDLHRRTNELLDRSAVQEARQDVEACGVHSEPDRVPFAELDRVKQLDRQHAIKGDADAHRPRKRRRSTMSSNETTAIILALMQDYGSALTSKELYRLFVAKTGEDMAERSFRSNTLRRAIDQSKRIKTIGQPNTVEKLYELIKE